MSSHSIIRRPYHRATHQGFVLIDVLMSVLLFSVGVLALIGLQSRMTRVQTESKIRADASYLANELLGQIWSDTAQLTFYTASGCASLDRCKQWQSKVTSSLPNGVGTVNADTTTGDVTITISWSVPSGDTHQYVTQTSITKAGG